MITSAGHVIFHDIKCENRYLYSSILIDVFMSGESGQMMDYLLKNRICQKDGNIFIWGELKIKGIILFFIYSAKVTLE